MTAVGEFDAIGSSDEPGFYLQDPVGDDDIATSDAVFIISDASVTVGAAVTVQGRVEESGFSRELTYTRVQASSVTINSRDNALPAPVLLGTGGRVPPSENIDDDGLTAFEPETDGLDFFESLEAMRVTVQAPLTISPTSRFGEVFVVVDGGASASGLSARQTLNISPDDFNPEKIQIDPGREFFDPQFVELPLVDAGTQLADITGVVGYDFGNFQVQPDVEAGPVTVLNPSTIGPESTALTASDSALRVA
ncbi:MAG: endonuclease, partial [Myxococcota bacterium]